MFVLVVLAIMGLSTLITLAACKVAGDTDERYLAVLETKKKED